MVLNGKYYDRVQIAKSVLVANTWQHLPHLHVLFCGPLASNFSTEYFVNNRRFL